MSKNYKRTLVTCALPYANGPVHIGHLAGVYVPADIYVRYLRMRGEDVLYICGSDEHGVPITIKARQQGCTPQDIVDKYHKIIKDSFTGLGINFDIYGRTSSEVHDKNASEFFRKLYDEGKFITKESEQYYDPEAKTFLADRYIVGTCPKCGGDAKRETDTMPQWAGSSWYFLRYMDPHNDKALVGEDAVKYWNQVDWYNGGMEHTTLHLLYSRFWHKFLYDIGVVPTKEPYAKRTSHGMILGEGGEKMSKSRGNVVNPDDIVRDFELTSFSPYITGGRLRCDHNDDETDFDYTKDYYETHDESDYKTKWPRLIKAMKDTFSDNLQTAVEKFLTEKCNVSQETLNQVRANLIE